jgi:hypothetical protein
MNPAGDLILPSQAFLAQSMEPTRNRVSSELDQEQHAVPASQKVPKRES